MDNFDLEKELQNISEQLKLPAMDSAQRTVLVVDDNIHIRTILRYHLEKENYKVIEAGDGEKAVNAANENKVDIVLMDIMMPVMDGYEACKQLKANSKTKNIPILMLTAKSQKEDVMEALQSGADDYIVKPFRKEIVLKKIQETLEKKSPQTEQQQNEKEARNAARKRIMLTLSWGPVKEDGLDVNYRSRVIDISLKGLSFEFDRCEFCGGYQKGTVHSGCVFAKFAQAFPDAKPLSILLSLSQEVILEITGKVAHVFRPPNMEKEIVGIVFDPLNPRNSAYLKRFLSEGKV